MRFEGCAAVAVVIGYLMLLAGPAASLAASIDSSLFGAWTTSEADCKRLFVRSGGGFAFRQPVDKFAQATIIGAQEILTPASTCRIQSATHVKDAVRIAAECHDTISYTSQDVQIRVKSPGEIIYSPTGDSALDTSLVKCGM